MEPGLAPGFHHPPPDPRAQQLEVLNEIGRIATSDLELRPMMQRITDALSNKFDWQFVALVLIDQDRNAFVCEAVTSAVGTHIHPGYSRQIGSGVVGQVALTGEPILLDDVRSVPNYVETMPDARSELCVPVHHKGQTVAVLNLESTRLAAFHDQLPLLTTVADQIAGAIANARMYDELKQRAGLMQMMSEVSRTALDAATLDELLHRVVDYVHSRFPVEIVSILMHEHGEHVERAVSGAMQFVGQRWPIARGVVGRCIRTAQTQFVADVSSDPEYVDVNPSVVAELAVPIRFRDEVLGVLNVESRSAELFTPANLLAFEAFADQIAGAINLFKLRAALEEKNQALEQANAHLAHAIETLQEISAQDGLTGVANRRHFDSLLTSEWRRGARAQTPLSLMLIDIDYFKAYNDASGHQAGDDVLRRVATALRDALQRAADVVARYGGEEFVVLLPDTNAEQVVRLAESLREKIAALGIVHPAAPQQRITISVGVTTTVPERDPSLAEAFVRRADVALYEAKRSGRNRVVAH
ncbi:MAG TPA: diguanylate cyclase [Thermoanaerobaculia bacterium]